jgi:hypothetical protein
MPRYVSFLALSVLQYACTALFYSAKSGHASCVAKLVELGANMGAVNKVCGCSLCQDLYHTCLAGSTSTRAWHNLPSLSAAQDGWTALHIAAQKGHLACVEVLVAAGANKEAQNKVCGCQPQSGPLSHVFSLQY